MGGMKVLSILFLAAVAILILAFAGFLTPKGPGPGEVTSASSPPESGSKGEVGETGTRTSFTTEVTQTKTEVTEVPAYETGFFRYNWLKYRIKAEGSELIYTLENLGEEVIDGRPCHHIRVKVEDSQRIEMEHWYDKVRRECVKAIVKIPDVGEMEIPCSRQPDSTPGQAVPTSGEGFVYVGEEIITVPAGTFHCWVFEGSGFRTWVAKQGLLVKWITSETEAVLLGYG